MMKEYTKPLVTIVDFSLETIMDGQGGGGTGFSGTGEGNEPI